jgi:predicted PurR-regulated permease PerM
MVDFIQETHTKYSADSIVITPPKENVKQWPIVGKKTYAIWKQASVDLPQLIKNNRPQIEDFAKNAISISAGMLGSLLQSLIALIVAGIMLAYGHEGNRSIFKIFNRFVEHDKSTSLHTLSTATVRSVALGVVGVSVIQALIFGVGFIFIDMPAGALIALIMIVFGIAQIPAFIFTIPTVAYIWYSGDSSTMNIVFSIYFIIGGFVDNVLKPIFLGRGVKAPMPVVLMGALGGMAAMGLLGLFIGATFLSLAYVIFMQWVEDGQTSDLAG